MSNINIHIKLLGPLEIFRDGQSVNLPPSRKTRALLGYLISTGSAHSRKHLCDLLWDGPADPRASLRWSLSKIRSLISNKNVEHIITERNLVKFDPRQTQVDLLQLLELNPNNLVSQPDNKLESCVELFRGTFMEDCEVPGSHRFNTWLDSQREYVSELNRRLLSALSTKNQDEPEKAIHFTRQLLQLDPYDEKAHVQLIRLWGELGEIEKALNQYKKCKTIFREELNTEPSPALEQARVSLMRIESGDAGGQASVGPPSPPPIVGRTAERKLFAEIIEQAYAGNASEMVLISGEPGIGKTHLLKIAGEQVINSGGSFLWGEAYYLEMTRPYAPWSELLENLQLASIPESTRSRIAPLLPGHKSGSLNNDRNQLFNAVVELLRILGSDRKPLALLFDNLQWFDIPSLSLLNYVLREVRNSNIFVVCSARSAELEENRRAFWLTHSQRKEKNLRHIDLSPLSLEETLQLTESIDPGLNARKVFRESNGNPLFAVELAYALKNGEMEELPGSLLTLIQDRLSLLDDDTKNLLSWAAVWGHDFSLEQLSKASDFSIPQIIPCIEILERYNILRAESDNKYNFVHELVQNAACQSLSEPRKKVIHRRIAQTMMEISTPDTDRSIAIMYHAEEGGDNRLLVQSCLAAAQRSLEVFAYREADLFAQKGLGILTHLSNNEQAPLRLGFMELYVHPGMTSLRKPNLLEQLRSCVGTMRQTGQSALVRKGLFLISNLYYQQGDFHKALERIIKAEEAGRSSDPATMIRAVADTAKCFGMIDQKIDRAEALALEARGLAEEMDLVNTIYEIPLALGLVHHHRGQYDKAILLYGQALELIRQQEDHWWECYVLQRFPMVELERGCPDAALSKCEELLPIADKMGEGSEAPFARALMGLSRYHLHKSGPEELDRELQVLRRIDSKWMVAYVQTITAEFELTSGNVESARSRAEEAIDLSTLVDRHSEKAWASSILVQILFKSGNRKEADSMLTALKREYGTTCNSLSSRSSRALRKVIRLSGAK